LTFVLLKGEVPIAGRIKGALALPRGDLGEEQSTYPQPAEISKARERSWSFGADHPAKILA